MTKRHLVIATRESPLAIKQSEIIKQLLQTSHPHLSIDLSGMTTTGDRRLDVTLEKIGGKGLFVKELEEALYANRADIAVHSMKDLPMDLPPGLILAVIAKREDPRDAFVSNQYQSLMQLPRGAAVGTSSLRRQTQIRALRPDIVLHDLRGNVNTRLAKLDNGNFDAIILAAAGLIRIGLQSRIRSYLSTEQCIPAAGQGALGIECRADDQATLKLINDLNDKNTADCVIAERALCRKLNGGCSVPIGAYAQLHHNKLTLHGMVANRDGSKIIRANFTADREQAEMIGEHVALELIHKGAENILREFHD